MCPHFMFTIPNRPGSECRVQWVHMNYMHKSGYVIRLIINLRISEVIQLFIIATAERVSVSCAQKGHMTTRVARD